MVAAVAAEDLCDGFLCVVPGAALAGAPQQLCELPFCLDGPHAYAALPLCPSLPLPPLNIMLPCPALPYPALPLPLPAFRCLYLPFPSPVLASHAQRSGCPALP